jgi:outer membrane protein TolC
VRRALELSLIILFGALSTPAVASVLNGQASGEPSGITLQEAIDAALEHGTELQLGEAQVRIGEGGLLAARAPFDTRLTTALSTERVNGTSPGAGVGATSVMSTTITSSVAVPKRFRSGVVITPRVNIERADVADIRGALTSRASVELDATVPLLRDRGGGAVTAGARAARRVLEADILDARHSAASGVLAVVIAYWNDLAADERLEVYRSSELRASQLVDDTRRLVEADERPAADLDQLMANLALKHAVRLTGEQASVEAREQLALAMGAQWDAADALPRPSTSFPELRPEDVSRDRRRESPIDVASSTGALGDRADLAAMRARRNAALVQMQAARNGLLPRLDLSVGLGYQGVASGRGFGGALSSLYRNVYGLDAAVTLSYELPLASLAARGGALQSAAAYDQARIREAQLTRQISSGVRVARAALRHGRGALLASRSAVALSREAVENEKRKFQLGMSTLFDVILAEDALTNARLGEIAGQQAYAVAIARLRYETGVILDASSEVPRVNAASLGKEP